MQTIKKVEDLKVNSSSHKSFYFLPNGHIGYGPKRGLVTKLGTICDHNKTYYGYRYLYYIIIYSNLIYKNICQSCLEKLSPELVEDIKFHLIIKKLKGQK